jgi:hypothetical protein
MIKVKLLFRVLLLSFILLVAAGCDNSDNPNNTTNTTNQNNLDNNTNLNDNMDADTDDTSNDTPDNTDTAATESDIDAWLQQVNNDAITPPNPGGAFEWGMGYLVYYGSMETIGVDNLIYYALEAHSRMNDDEVRTDEQNRNDQNLIDLTEGITYDPAVDLTNQIAQTSDIRNGIMDRVVESQADMTPDEALASNEIIGIVAPPAPEAVGAKYLVYTQDTPDAEFKFLGVVIAADAAAQASGETYSFQGWNELPLIGDATGPFWDDLPAGVSGDPAATDEGRPGVLLVSEAMYDDIQNGDTG